MGLEEIENRLGSLVKPETVSQLKSSVWKERLEGLLKALRTLLFSNTVIFIISSYFLLCSFFLRFAWVVNLILSGSSSNFTTHRINLLRKVPELILKLYFMLPLIASDQSCISTCHRISLLAL